MARAKPHAPAPKARSDAGDGRGTPPLSDAIARVDKKRKASSAKKISKLIEEHPDEAVTVLRGWLHQSQ